jgi:hypothetical protein
MPKPSSLPEWATDANYPAGAEPEAGTPTKVPPSTNQDTVGWRPSQKPPATEWNWWMHKVYEWLAYVDAGIIDGDFQVTGESLFEGPTVFDDAVTANLGASAGLNAHFEVSGTGRYKHGDRTLVVPAAAFQPSGYNPASSSSWPVLNGGYYSFSTPPQDKIVAPIALPSGKRIKSIEWRINKASVSSGMVLSLYRRVADADSALATTTDSTSGASWSTNTALSAVNHTVDSIQPLWLEVQAGDAAHQFAYATITYDEP